MSLPVSQYEELLAEVRGLRRKAQRVQQLATPLLSSCSTAADKKQSSSNYTAQDGDVNFLQRGPHKKMESFLTKERTRIHDASTSNYDYATTTTLEGDETTTCSEEDECGIGAGNNSPRLSVSSEPIAHGRDRRGEDSSSSAIFQQQQHGTWPGERTMWNSDPVTTVKTSLPLHNNRMQEVTSVMSFASSAGGVPLLDRVLGSPTPTTASLSRRSSQQLEAKVDMVYSLLAMLSGQEHADMGETLLALSTNPESCMAMRQSGCIPLLVQMVQSDKEAETRTKAVQALHNLIHSQPDEKIRKRETRIFKLLEHVRGYNEALRLNKEIELEQSSSASSEDGDKHPVQTVAHVMKLSFDEGHRQAICQLGGIQTIASLVEIEHLKHGSTADEAHCILMRRYACMALTNLTFGDSGNKALLCSLRDFMRALVVQLQSPSDELRQVTASVLRNLSWRADASSKEILREVASVTGLMRAAMLDNKENTLKSILSALWNLSAHCTENKSEICAVDGALGFLVDMLTYKTPSKSLAIIENSGGILRNISSQIAVRDDYREILRQHNCLQVLLQQLKSPSLTIVSNACGTLWNLSAKCVQDQEALWQMGAPSMLRSLNHSKHKMIAMGSSAALKNLLSARPAQSVLPQMDSTALAMDLPVLPTLGARKQKALLQDLDQSLSETYENIEKESPAGGATVPMQKIPNTSTSNSACAPEECLLNNSTNFLINTKPSTSTSSTENFRTKSGSSSLPFMETSQNSNNSSSCSKYTGIPVLRNNQKGGVTTGGESSSAGSTAVDGTRKKSFTKPKNVAKNTKSSSSIKVEDKECNNKVAECNNQQCNDDLSHNELLFNNILSASRDKDFVDVFNLESSSILIDNEKKLSQPVPPKEVTTNIDEKDHCSIEDMSDADNNRSFELLADNRGSSVGCFKFDQTSDQDGIGKRKPGSSSSSHSVQQCSSYHSREDAAADFFSTKNNSSCFTSGFESDLPHSSVTNTVSEESIDVINLEDIAIELENFDVDFDSIKTLGGERDEKQDQEKTPLFERCRNVPIDMGLENEPVENTRQDQPKISIKHRAKFGLNSGIPLPKTSSSSSTKIIAPCGAIQDQIQNQTEEQEDEEFAEENNSIIVERVIENSCENSTAASNNSGDHLEASSEVSREEEHPPQFSIKTNERLASGLSRHSTPIKIDDFQTDSPVNNTDSVITSGRGTEKRDGGCGVGGGGNLRTTVSMFSEDCQVRHNNFSSGGEQDEAIINSVLFPVSRGVQAGRVVSCGENALAIEEDSSNISLLHLTNLGSKHQVLMNTFSDAPESSATEASTEAFNFSDDNKSVSLPKIDSPTDNLQQQEDEQQNPGEVSDVVAAGSAINTDDLAPYLESDFIKDDRDRVLEKSCDAKSLIVDNRMLDPDAMIESLDRFTAELVSQASHLQQNKTSSAGANDNNTWNEDDTSPNEVTFPSISGSAPNVITFGSTCDSNDLLHQDSSSEPIVQLSEDQDQIDTANNHLNNEQQSNDFSSLNTTTTMTESTLIAIEATRMATVFRTEAEMSHSISSVQSLELDSGNVAAASPVNSPKLDVGGRKRSLPVAIVAKRALNHHSLSTTTAGHGGSHSLESLENHSLSNLDQMHPPSFLNDVLDIEGSTTSLASLPSETTNEIKADFVINGAVNKNSPIFSLPSNSRHHHNLNSFSDLEHINPPSLFNEITDMCNSLADIPTEAICSETECFEDCYTHVAETVPTLEAQVSPPQQTEDDVTEFSDATSATPIQSDLNSSSSADNTPKKLRKDMSKRMTSKQRRNFARDRYKTYTVAAEMVMKEEAEKSKDSTTSDDFKTEDCCFSTDDYKTCCDIDTESQRQSPNRQSKLTPKERRQMDRSRFETHVVDEAVTSILQQPLIADFATDSSGNNSAQPSPTIQSPARTKLSIRRNFMQKRLENKDRFKTQTLDESCFSPPASASPPPLSGDSTSEAQHDLHFLVQREANLVLKSLRETKTSLLGDDLLECETLSLVSNDDDSEHNSGSSINYRTYHKSWGARKNNVPVIAATAASTEQQRDLVNCQSGNLPQNLPDVSANCSDSEEQQQQQQEEESQPEQPAKPKIVKPTLQTQHSQEESPVATNNTNEMEGKGIRGRRKPLYSNKTTSNVGSRMVAPKTLKPVKNMTSNLVKNVTSTLRSAANKQNVTMARPLAPQSMSRVTSSGYGTSRINTPKTSPAKTRSIPVVGASTNTTITKPKSSFSRLPTAPNLRVTEPQPAPTLERQGTFTKDETPAAPAVKSRLPVTSTRIPQKSQSLPANNTSAATISKLPPKSVASSTINNNNHKSLPARTGIVAKPAINAVSDRANRNVRVSYGRSTSAESREVLASKRIQNSTSSQNLKTGVAAAVNKKSTIQQRSSSNSSLNSNEAASTSRKQVTSKIASLWKKIEESKKQPPKKDTRVWIQPAETLAAPAPSVARSGDSCDTGNHRDGGVVMRNKTQQQNGDAVKRISRLGSFIVMDETEDVATGVTAGGVRVLEQVAATH